MDILNRFGPKTGNHPSIGQECPACHIPFKEGDYTTLIPLGPGNDPEAQEKCRQGRPYNAVAVEVHYSCATGSLGQEFTSDKLLDLRQTICKHGNLRLRCPVLKCRTERVT